MCHVPLARAKNGRPPAGCQAQHGVKNTEAGAATADPKTQCSTGRPYKHDAMVTMRTQHRTHAQRDHTANDAETTNPVLLPDCNFDQLNLMMRIMKTVPQAPEGRPLTAKAHCHVWPVAGPETNNYCSTT